MGKRMETDAMPSSNLSKQKHEKKTNIFTPHRKRRTPRTPLLNHPIKPNLLDLPTRHGRPHIPLEALPVHPQILRRLLIQRIRRVGLQEQKLQPDNHGVQVQHGLPVLAQDVQTHVPFQVDVGMVDLLHALHLGRIVREVLVDGECECECSGAVHAFVGLDGEDEVLDVVGVGEGHFHRAAQRELGQIC